MEPAASESTRRTALQAAALALLLLGVTFGLVVLGRLLLKQVGTSGAEGIWPKWPLMHGLVRWDAGWYAEIAEKGYWYRPGEGSPVAFFPGYPMAVRAVSWLGFHPYLAGVIVSAVCGVLSVTLFAIWASGLRGAKQGLRATVALGLYPYAFYLFGVMYPEAFFLTLVVGAFLCLERRWLWAAALLGALATATRPVAPAIVVGLLVRHWELRRAAGEKLRPGDAVLLLAGAGMAGFMLFQWIQFGEPMAFARTQASPGWDHVPGPRTWLKLGFFEAILGNARPVTKLQFLLHAGLTVGALALAWSMRRTLGWGYAAYVALVIAIPALAMKDFWGMGRYGMAAFPCFLHVVLLLRDRPRTRWALASVSAALFVLMALQFGRGTWVA